MQRSAEEEVAVERPVYDLTIFKLHCGKLTLKCYTKGERVLRIEAMVHNTQQLDCGRSLEKFPHLVSKLKAILERFQQALSCIDQCFIADQTLGQLPALGWTKPGLGIDFNKPRMRWVVEAVLALSPNPAGFSATELACQVRDLGGPVASHYGRHQASYDLKKPLTSSISSRRSRNGGTVKGKMFRRKYKSLWNVPLSTIGFISSRTDRSSTIAITASDCRNSRMGFSFIIHRKRKVKACAWAAIGGSP
jgi:hypothetical protein